jgi:hypothetical protein
MTTIRIGLIYGTNVYSIIINHNWDKKRTEKYLMEQYDTERKLIKLLHKGNNIDNDGTYTYMYTIDSSITDFLTHGLKLLCNHFYIMKERVWYKCDPYTYNDILTEFKCIKLSNYI